LRSLHYIFVLYSTLNRWMLYLHLHKYYNMYSCSTNIKYIFFTFRFNYMQLYMKPTCALSCHRIGSALLSGKSRWTTIQVILISWCRTVRHHLHCFSEIKFMQDIKNENSEFKMTIPITWMTENWYFWYGLSPLLGSTQPTGSR
jgi:hypothetical protein